MFEESEMAAGRRNKTVLVTGATGFIGGRLVGALAERGYEVVATSRRGPAGGTGHSAQGVTWRSCDLLDKGDVAEAVRDTKVGYFLVHSMGGGRTDYAARDRRAAENFATAAARAGLERIVYLGGPVRERGMSQHLRSRAEVGEVLRASGVPTIELRASMIVGHGGASWRIVRDLAKRLPVMLLPAWLNSRTRPVAIDDTIAALVAAAEIPLENSVSYDIPGPDTLSGREILERIAALDDRRIPSVGVPLLTPRLSAAWLRFVSGADYDLARELVVGLATDLLPESERYWELIGHTELVPFDAAARRALASEPERPEGVRARLARLEESLVSRTPGRARPT